jgi:hypothetical protein
VASVRATGRAWSEKVKARLRPETSIPTPESEFHQISAQFPTILIPFIALAFDDFPGQVPSILLMLGQWPYVIRVLGAIKGHRAIFRYKPAKPSAINFPFQVQRVDSGHCILQRAAMRFRSKQIATTTQCSLHPHG